MCKYNAMLLICLYFWQYIYIILVFIICIILISGYSEVFSDDVKCTLSIKHVACGMKDAVVGKELISRNYIMFALFINSSSTEYQNNTSRKIVHLQIWAFILQRPTFILVLKIYILYIYKWCLFFLIWI
jgi:hypothetical protein